MIAYIHCLDRYIVIRGTQEVVEEISFQIEKPLEKECSSGEVNKAKLQIQEYLSGFRKTFQIQYQINKGTEFQRDVWATLETIPYGKTMNYQEIAIYLNRDKAVRAVGGACHNNPIAIIIPCHRVIGKNASLTGFAGGIDFKQYLLDIERKHV